MIKSYRKNMNRVCIDYPQVHLDTRRLFLQLKSITPRGVVLVSVARGGWVTSRILAASYEKDNLESHSFSVDATYQNHGYPNECAVLMQALDDKAIASINLLSQDKPIVIVDSVCQTGRELLTVKKYLSSLFTAAEVYVAVMNWVRYKESSRTPWRVAHLQPDFYGCLIETDQMPYVEYPWEYDSLKDFQKLRSKNDYSSIKITST